MPPRMNYTGPGRRVTVEHFREDTSQRTCLARIGAVGTTYLVFDPPEDSRLDDFVVYVVPEGPTVDTVGQEGSFYTYALALNHASSRALHMIIAETS